MVSGFKGGDDCAKNGSFDKHNRVTVIAAIETLFFTMKLHP